MYHTYDASLVLEHFLSQEKPKQCWKTNIEKNSSQQYQSLSTQNLMVSIAKFIYFIKAGLQESTWYLLWFSLTDYL